MRLVHTAGDAFVQGGALIGGSGVATCLPESLEDLWHAYNLVLVGDDVQATAVRKVKQESSTGSVESQRVKVKITIRVRKVEFDPEGGELRLNGTILSEHQHVRLGSHQTLTLELHRPFALSKEAWDSMALERLRQSVSEDLERADLWAVLIKEGLAQLCLVTDGMTIVKARLETHIPKKGAPAALLGAKRSREAWFNQLLAAILRHVDFGVLRCVVLAGPGFTKDSFWEWLGEEAQRRELRELLQSKPKWVLTHASSAYKHALHEVLRDPAVAHRVAETKAGAEVRVLREFMQMMEAQPDRVAYGPRHVQAACEQGAVDKLLLVDSLLRAQHVGRRAQYVSLVEAVKPSGAAVHVFSDKHPSGEQLGMLSGVAAILRFPLPLDDMWEAEAQGGGGGGGGGDADDSSSSSSTSDDGDDDSDEDGRLEQGVRAVRLA
jgi:protein pelota